jgi:hypothetical protein
LESIIPDFQLVLLFDEFECSSAAAAEQPNFLVWFLNFLEVHETYTP